MAACYENQKADFQHVFQEDWGNFPFDVNKKINYSSRMWRPRRDRVKETG